MIKSLKTWRTPSLFSVLILVPGALTIFNVKFTCPDNPNTPTNPMQQVLLKSDLEQLTLKLDDADTAVQIALLTLAKQLKEKTWFENFSLTQA